MILVRIRKRGLQQIIFLLFCDDFSDDSKNRSSDKIISYASYCFLMILARIRKRGLQQSFISFILFCDDFSDDAKNRSSKNRLCFMFILLMFMFYVLYCFVMILVRIQKRHLNTK